MPTPCGSGHGGLVEQGVELVADACQLQPRELFDQHLVFHGHQKLPPATAADSSSGRSSAGADAVAAPAPTGRGPVLTPSRCARSTIRPCLPRCSSCSDDLFAVVDALLAASRHHLHALADQPPRHRVGVGVHGHRAVRVHGPDQVPQLAERLPPGAGRDPARLVRGAVPALVGDLPTRRLRRRARSAHAAPV